jgi:hypothetical protein
MRWMKQRALAGTVLMGGCMTWLRQNPRNVLWSVGVLCAPGVTTAPFYVALCNKMPACQEVMVTAHQKVVAWLPNIPPSFPKVGDRVAGVVPRRLVPEDCYEDNIKA